MISFFISLFLFLLMFFKFGKFFMMQYSFELDFFEE